MRGPFEFIVSRAAAASLAHHVVDPGMVARQMRGPAVPAPETTVSGKLDIQDSAAQQKNFVTSRMLKSALAAAGGRLFSEQSTTTRHRRRYGCVPCFACDGECAPQPD